MKNRKVLYVIVMILSAAAAILNAAPNAVLMRFADENGVLCKYVSGFSMLPVGYGIWGAMAAGIGSVILFLLGIAGMVRGGGALGKWMFGICAFSLLMRLTLLLFGSMTMMGVLICVLLASETVLLFYCRNVH